MSNRVVIEDDLMFVLNEYNQGLDCNILVPAELARGVFEVWHREYGIDVEAAMQLVYEIEADNAAAADGPYGRIE